jgi:hypothetical protein
LYEAKKPAFMFVLLSLKQGLLGLWNPERRDKNENPTSNWVIVPRALSAPLFAHEYFFP